MNSRSNPSAAGGRRGRSTGVIAWFIENRVAANLLFFGISLAGFAALSGLPQELMPESGSSAISIRTVFPGASAGTIEEGGAAPPRRSARRSRGSGGDRRYGHRRARRADAAGRVLGRPARRRRRGPRAGRGAHDASGGGGAAGDLGSRPGAVPPAARRPRPRGRAQPAGGGPPRRGAGRGCAGRGCGLARRGARPRDRDRGSRKRPSSGSGWVSSRWRRPSAAARRTFRADASSPGSGRCGCAPPRRPPARPTSRACR